VVSWTNTELDGLCHCTYYCGTRRSDNPYRGRYRGPPVMAQNSGYDQFPPVAKGWEIIHFVPDEAPPLQAEEKVPPT
jgi:hypothetical protein